MHHQQQMKLLGILWQPKTQEWLVSSVIRCLELPWTPDSRPIH